MTARAAKPLPVRVLHWTVAWLFMLAVATGLTAFDFDLAMRISTRDGLFVIHRLSGMLAGIALLLWAGYRLGRWRVTGFVPFALLPAIFQGVFALLCFAVPLLPWIARALNGRTQELYMPFPRANLVSHPALPQVYLLLDWHKFLAWLAMSLAIIHVAVATYHGLWRKDGVVGTMLRTK